MSQESTTLTVTLKKLDVASLEKIKGYLKARSTTVDSFVDETLWKYLISTDEAFKDARDCPACLLTSRKHVPLKGMPILEAEKRGFVRLGSEESRQWAENKGTYFVVCLECLWQGYPDHPHEMPG